MAEPAELIDKQIDRLYGLPLDEFTAARNELAKGLRASGDAEAAERVRELEKPSLAAWAVNQLARQRPEEVRALLRAAERLRAAHASGHAGKLREASAREREAIRALAESARDVLAEAGRKPSGATVDRVSATLRGVAADEQARELLERGLLTSDVDPTIGFAGLAPVAAPPKPRDGAARRQRQQEARELVRRLRAEVRQLRGVAQVAEREAERAHEAAEHARSELERMEEQLEQAESDAREL